MVVWFFLAVPWVCLRFVIVEFPDHTHLLFLVSKTLVWPSHLLNHMALIDVFRKIKTLNFYVPYVTNLPMFRCSSDFSPLSTGNPFTGTLANIEEPDDAAFHQDMHSLLG